MANQQEPRIRQQLLSVLKSLRSSIWLFPAVLAVLLMLLTALRISGSSVGVYSQVYEGGQKDKNFIAGMPRGVRSDEWLVSTPLIVAQSKHNYPRVNKNIGNGEDVSLMADIPYKDWSTLFKPQNLAFLVMPLEYAFAFRWWLMIFLLILAAYFLALEIFPKKILRAVLLAFFVGFTPMVFWWYSPGIILCLTYSLLIVLLGLRLFRINSLRPRLVHALLLAYVLSCFGLLLYPPFQISCLIAVTIFLLGWVFENFGSRRGRKKLFALWPFAVISIAIPLCIGGLFYLTRKDAIAATTHTVYPGTRVEVSGGTEPLRAFSSFLSPNLEYDAKASTGYLKNQSEASNFIFIAPYLFLPSIYIIIRQKRKLHRTAWSLVFINVLIVFFLTRMYVSTPWLESFYRFFLLDKVPGPRLLIGLGLAGLFQLILIMKSLDNNFLKKRELWAMAVFGGISSLVTMLIIGVYTIHHFPVFIASFAKVFVFSAWVAAGIFLVLLKKFNLGLAVLALFSLLSVYKVDPIYRGLAPLTTSPIVKSIQSYPDNGNWVVLNDRLLINFPLAAGRHALNTVEFYPQLDLWRQLDKEGKYANVYNRYAHVLFSDDLQLKAPFELKYTDLFLVKFDSCGSFIQTNAKYVLSPKKLDQACLSFQKSIDSSSKQLYIYEIAPAP